jgi:C-terminal processing protease CtpA/Prc
MHSADSTRTTLARWRTARRAVLGAIVLAGSVVTSAAVMYRLGAHDCDAYQRVERAYTYSGIGVVIEQRHGEVVVRRVMPGSPAEGKLRSGARLVAVDGNAPADFEGWAAAIRGEPGTEVDVTVAYPCGGRKTITITRDIVRMAY